METSGGPSGLCSEFSGWETLQGLIALGIALSSCFLPCGKSNSCKKSYPQGSLNIFLRKTKKFAENAGFLFGKKKKKSWFSLLYCSFLSILLVERQSLEKTSKAGEKLAVVGQCQTKFAKLTTKNKESLFFWTTSPFPVDAELSHPWLFLKEFSIYFNGAVKQAVPGLTGQPANPAPVQGWVLYCSLLLWVKKAVKTTIRKLA